jgi:hypothetical protein
MSPELNTTATAGTLDLIRWTFTSAPAHRAAIEEYLGDLGFDVLVRDDCQFLVTWDEPDPDVDIDAIISEIWERNGVPFEVVQEEFHRSALHSLYHVEDDGVQGAA